MTRQQLIVNGVCQNCRRFATDSHICLTEEERFWAKVDKTESCWFWTGAIVDGYGQTRIGEKKENHRIYAHKFAYERLVGPVPIGKELDHLCRNRSCVNPKHMEPVSAAENLRRGEGRNAKNAVKRQCHLGHTLPQGSDYCVVCP